MSCDLIHEQIEAPVCHRIRGVPLKSALWPCNRSIAPGRRLAIIIQRAKIADLGRVNNYVTSHRRQG
jgi:hypothetical protein